MSLNKLIFLKSAIVSVIGLVGQGFNLLIMLLVAQKFGATKVADGFFIASTLTVAAVSMIGGIVKIVFIPLFVEERLQRPKSFPILIGQALLLTFVGSVLTMVGIVCLARFDLVSLSSDPGARTVAVQLIGTLVWSIPLLLWSMVFAAVLNAHQIFGIPEMLLSVRHIVVIGFLWFGTASYGVFALVWGNILGQCVVLIGLMYVTLVRHGIPVQVRGIFSQNWKNILQLCFYPFLAYVVVQLQPITSSYIGSLLAEGNVAILHYGQKIAVVPIFLIGSGFTGVILSYWSQAAAEKDPYAISKSLNQLISCAFTFLTPLVLTMILLRHQVITLIFPGKAEHSIDVAATAKVTALFLLTTIPMFVQMMVVRVLLAKKDVKFLFLLTLPTAIVHPLLSYSLAIYAGWDASGIAFSFFVTNFLIALGTLLTVHLRHVPIDFSHIGKGILEVVGASFPLALLIWFWPISFALNTGWIPLFFNVACASLSSYVLYFALLWYRRHENVRLFGGWAWYRFQKRFFKPYG